MKCKHKNADHVSAGEIIHWYSWNAASTTAQCEQFRCLDCGHWLSLGPSSETGVAAVEIRAAEIAVSLQEGGCTMSGLECHGFNETLPTRRGGGEVVLHTDSMAAGDLARQITEHGEGK